MNSRLGHTASTAAFVLLAAAPVASQVVFTDITEQAGVALTEVLIESVAWGDYDNDGDEDLYLTGDGTNRLFRNDGGGDFTDVTETARVGNSRFSVGTAFGDLDNDGDLDLYVVNFDVGPDVLYRNDGPVGPGGAYRFTDITGAAGTTLERSSRGMAFVDYDRDGLLDIFVLAIGPNILYHNEGGLHFRNVAAALGVDQDDQGVGVVALDLDNNGWPDLFTGNRSGNPSNLYLNQGGEFEDIASSAGIAARGLGMGVAAFDADNDLDFDLYWTWSSKTWVRPREPTTRGAGASASTPATWISTAGRTSSSPTASTIPLRRMCSFLMIVTAPFPTPLWPSAAVILTGAESPLRISTTTATSISS